MKATNVIICICLPICTACLILIAYVNLRTLELIPSLKQGATEYYEDYEYGPDETRPPQEKMPEPVY